MISSILSTNNIQLLVSNVMISGLSMYLYDSIQDILLYLLEPMSIAVINIIKPVCVFVCVYAWTHGQTFPKSKAIGSLISLVGMLLYICLK